MGEAVLKLDLFGGYRRYAAPGVSNSYPGFRCAPPRAKSSAAALRLDSRAASHVIEVRAILRQALLSSRGSSKTVLQSAELRVTFPASPGRSLHRTQV